MEDFVVYFFLSVLREMVKFDDEGFLWLMFLKKYIIFFDVIV